MAVVGTFRIGICDRRFDILVDYSWRSYIDVYVIISEAFYCAWWIIVAQICVPRNLDDVA